MNDISAQGEMTLLQELHLESVSSIWEHTKEILLSGDGWRGREVQLSLNAVVTTGLVLCGSQNLLTCTDSQELIVTFSEILQVTV